MDTSYSPEQFKEQERAAVELLGQSVGIVPASLSVDEYNARLMNGDIEKNQYAILSKLHTLVETLGPEALGKTGPDETPDPSLNPDVRNQTQPLAKKTLLHADHLNDQAISVLFSTAILPVCLRAAVSTGWGDEDSVINNLAHQMAVFYFIHRSGSDTPTGNNVFFRWLDKYFRMHYDKCIIQDKDMKNKDMSKAVQLAFGLLFPHFAARFSDHWAEGDRDAIMKKMESYGRQPDYVLDEDPNREDYPLWIEHDPILHKVVIEAFSAFAEEFPEKMEVVLKVLEANVVADQLAELWRCTLLMLNRPVEQRPELYRKMFVSAAEASKKRE